MDTDDDLPDYFAGDAASEREDQEKRRLLIWPWLVLVGPAAVAVGAIGPLIS